MARTPKWEPDGELIRCKIHKVSFGKTETCPDCEPLVFTDTAATNAAMFAPPDGCATIEEHEQWLMARAEVWKRRADEILEGQHVGQSEEGYGPDPTTVAAKAEDNARKYRMAAIELTHGRDRKRLLDELRRERARTRKGWGN